MKCWLKALELTRGEIRPVKSHRGLDSCASNENVGNVFVWVDATTKYDATAVYPCSCGRGLNIYITELAPEHTFLGEFTVNFHAEEVYQ